MIFQDNPFSLSGKHIVISGASSGIGRQCAISCAKAGAVVSLLGRSSDRLKATRETLDNPEKHRWYSIDLTNQDDVAGLVKDIVKETGKIHGLLNVAGISDTRALRSIDESKLDLFFRTNVYSSIYLTKEVCRKTHFSEKGGSIVFFSSVMALLGEPGKTVYGMTKGALLAGAKSLACELSPRQIRVNTISPGVIVTPINENLPHIKDPEKRKELEEKHLLGLGATEDVANACIFLLADASKWVTGSNLSVDGGYTAK